MLMFPCLQGKCFKFLRGICCFFWLFLVFVGTQKTFFSTLFKGTESPDGLSYGWHVWIGLGLNKLPRWVLNFCECAAPVCDILGWYQILQHKIGIFRKKRRRLRPNTPLPSASGYSLLTARRKEVGSKVDGFSTPNLWKRFLFIPIN